MKRLCPCCGKGVIVEYKRPKWQGEKPKVIITHRKWPLGSNSQEGGNN